MMMDRVTATARAMTMALLSPPLPRVEMAVAEPFPSQR
jgi:hypothetical protein